MTGLSGVVDAAPTIYTSEPTFLAAIAGFTSVAEGFEGAEWEPTRADGLAGSITSQGITWSAGELLRTGPGWRRTGSYGVFDSFGDPDLLLASSGSPLVAVGGWFSASGSSLLTLSLDSAPVVTFTPPTSGHLFRGVVDPAGFSTANMLGSSGHWGADDFTFAFQVPEPSIFVLTSLGLVGLFGMRRRKFVDG